MNSRTPKNRHSERRPSPKKRQHKRRERGRGLSSGRLQPVVALIQLAAALLNFLRRS
jgi:hypothetical protein